MLIKRNNRTMLSTGLGWFSIGLGLVELLGGQRVADVLGMNQRRRILRIFGLREIAVGIGLLTAKNARPWLWARVAGDVLDLALLGSGLDSANDKRARVGIAGVSVAGVTALDVVAAAAH